jgi:hypothetical protein
MPINPTFLPPREQRGSDPTTVIKVSPGLCEAARAVSE